MPTNQIIHWLNRNKLNLILMTAVTISLQLGLQMAGNLVFCGLVITHYLIFGTGISLILRSLTATPNQNPHQLSYRLWGIVLVALPQIFGILFDAIQL